MFVGVTTYLIRSFRVKRSFVDLLCLDSSQLVKFIRIGVSSRILSITELALIRSVFALTNSVWVVN